MLRTAGARPGSEVDLGSVDLTGEDLGQPALLTLWPVFDIAAKGVEPQEMESLRAALSEAFLALQGGTASPWIITSAGLILTPSSLVALMSQADAFSLAPA